MFSFTHSKETAYGTGGGKKSFQISEFGTNSETNTKTKIWDDQIAFLQLDASHVLPDVTSTRSDPEERKVPHVVFEDEGDFVGLQQPPPNLHNSCIRNKKLIFDPNCLEDVRNCGAQERSKLIQV